MKIKSFVFFIFFVWIGSISAQLDVTVDGAAAILINAKTGTVLYEKRARETMFPASLTKMATALYSLERAQHDLESSVAIDYEMIRAIPPAIKREYPGEHPPYRLETDGTMMGLKVGEEVTLRSLLFGLMLSSGNDAANALAYKISGSVDRFMQDLNSYLIEHGIMNTFFLNPHGLHDDRHVTTAYDLARLAVLGMKNPLFREIVSSTRLPRPATNKQPASFFIQNNKLLRPGRFYYPKALGIKTGRTSKAGYNLVAAAEDKGRLLIAVILNNKDAESRYRDAIELFEAAFREEVVDRKVFAKEQDLFRHAVKGGKTPIEAVLSDDLIVSYYPSEEPQMQAKIIWNDANLPIEKGSVVGDLFIVGADGATLAQAPMYSTCRIDKTMFGVIGDLFQDAKILLFHRRMMIVMGLAVFILLLALFLRFRRKESLKTDEKP